MLKIYTAESIIDAQLLCDQLLDHRIEAMVKGAYLTGAVGELPPDQLVSVWIEDDAEEARAKTIVKTFEANRRAEARDIYCCACGEVNQHTFRICWSCGENLDVDP